MRLWATGIPETRFRLHHFCDDCQAIRAAVDVEVASFAEGVLARSTQEVEAFRVKVEERIGATGQ